MESILFSTEVDLYIDSMKCSSIEHVGQKSWFEWHNRLSKLNQQALLEAVEMREESVKENLISAGKIPILVHEAICIAIWKKKILPHILNFESNPSNTFTIYSVLYHEAISVSLLETVLFHSNSCEALEDSALDLLEYCVEAVTQILNYTYTEPNINENSKVELERQIKDLEFDIGIRAISILRYFAEYLESLPLAVTSKIYTTLDVPLLFCELINRKPWTRTDEKGNVLKYIDGKWRKIDPETCIKLTKTEAQIWIGLRQLLLDSKCLSQYTFNDFRRDQFTKLQKYLHEYILDQLAPLIDLKTWLCQLASCSLRTNSKTPVLLEVIPQIKEMILNKGRNRWKQIAKEQVQIFFKQDHENLVEMAQSLSDSYNTDFIEKLENVNLQVCSGCGGNGTKRCSRCKNEWYCSRNCQVKHWPQHKEHCDIMVGEN